MRAVRLASLLVLVVAAIPACSDDVTTPVAVLWLDWSDSVTAGVPFGVRLSGLMSGHPASLRVGIRVARDTVTIQPYSTEPPCRGTCPDVLYGYDTLVWVPALAATAPRTATMRAPASWQSVEGPWPLFTFGTLTVSPDTVIQPLQRSVGFGSPFQDALGCFFFVPVPGRRLVSADQSPGWTPGVRGLIYGRVDPVAGSPCVLDAPVILVDSIII
jgi:hypothetical protein